MPMNSHIQTGATSVLPCVASTAGISATEKFDFWHDVVSRNLVDLDYSLVDRTPFEAMFSGATVDAINVSKIKATAHRVSRSAATISRLGAEAMVFNFVLSGRMIAEQDGRTATIGVGEGVVCDARRAYSLHFDQPFEIACVRLPHQALSHEIAGLQRITATNFNSTTQLCPLVFSYLSELLRRTDSISDGSSRRISNSFIELVAAMLAEATEASPAPISDYRNLALIRIKDFVERNLGDFDLDPTAVAAALKFSPRYINQLLETEGTSLSRYIWRRRLEMAASDFENSGLDSLSISTIALNNGFNDLSHFSKAFRERFGESPRNYRRKKNQAI
jgi:AraC family transcriptional regulator, positive regulator of tynA and feaB